MQRSYVFGGFLRDAFKGVISDDVDILFRSRNGSTVPYLESVAKGRGWPCYRKTDEHTGIVRSDFIAIGDKGSRSKFSGHPIGTPLRCRRWYGCLCNAMHRQLTCGFGRGPCVGVRSVNRQRV